MQALEQLQLATQQIISEENLFDLLDKILHNAMHVLKAEDGSLLLLDEETDELVFVLVHGDIRNELRGYRIASNVGIAGWVATHNQPLIVNNPAQDPRFYRQVDSAFNFSTDSIVCIPMTNRDKLIGVIELLNKRDRAQFSEADVTILSILGQVAASALLEIEMRTRAEEAQMA
jgi:GAF domain-containing protein